MSNYDEQYKKNCDRITIGFFVVLAVILIIVFSFDYIKYFFNGEKNIIVVNPQTFYFYSDEGNTNGDSYYVYEGNDESCWMDYDTETYHLLIKNNNFNKSNRHIYVTGYTYNYPFKPEVTVNNKYAKVSIEQSSKNEKAYHFEIPGPISPNETYTIKINIKDKLETMKIMFHEDYESSNIFNKIVYYTLSGTKYHYDKNCIVLKNSEHILSGTKDFCGKLEGCHWCA